MEYRNLIISNVPAISAIYFSLLQCKYDFYAIGRDTSLVNKLRDFITPESSECEYNFFYDIRQNTCEVYPYWPRAAMLETATFYINWSLGKFSNLNAYRDNIMSAKNISDKERDVLFWNWIENFPKSLKRVLESDGFNEYLKWENDWIAEQNQQNKIELRNICNILNICMKKFNFPVQNIELVLSPIKCVYSADYHLYNKKFIYCSGSLKKEAILHEFIHYTIHPLVEKRKDEIAHCKFPNLNIDTSYYLNNDVMGKLNAFEEHLVRMLTELIISDNIPNNLDAFLNNQLNS